MLIDVMVGQPKGVAKEDELDYVFGLQERPKKMPMRWQGSICNKVLSCRRGIIMGGLMRSHTSLVIGVGHE